MDADAIGEIFRAFGPVAVRRMFGGAGLYAQGRMFALVSDDVIYLKVGASNAADFEREALQSFAYTVQGKRRSIPSYRRMPERLYDEPEELAAWARGALAAAVEADGRPTAARVRPRAVRPAGPSPGRSRK